MILLDFSDQSVTYDRFVNDVAARIAEAMKAKDEPEFISQNKAFHLFGRANVERWRRQGKIEPCVRPGKLEYRTAELRKLKTVVQDYFV